MSLDEQRRSTRRPTNQLPDELVDRHQSDPVEQDAIERALGSLPERQRTALLLVDRVGLTGSEPAKTLGTSEGAAPGVPAAPNVS